MPSPESGYVPTPEESNPRQKEYLDALMGIGEETANNTERESQFLSPEDYDEVMIFQPTRELTPFEREALMLAVDANDTEDSSILFPAKGRHPKSFDGGASARVEEFLARTVPVSGDSAGATPRQQWRSNVGAILKHAVESDREVAPTAPIDLRGVDFPPTGPLSDIEQRIVATALSALREQAAIEKPSDREGWSTAAVLKADLIQILGRQVPLENRKGTGNTNNMAWEMNINRLDED